jgi:hypothetical protein
MNLIYKTDDRIKHEELKSILDDNKIKYTELDSDSFKLGFKVSKDNSQDFQMNIANLTAGRCSGLFYTEG